MGLMLFAASALFVLIWVLARRRALRTKQWPWVPGRILSSGLVRENSGETSSMRASVAYAYEVAGRPFQASRVGVGGGKGSDLQIVNRYPVGAQIRVFYDPAKPQSAVLEPGTAGLRVLPIFAVIAFVAAIVFSAGGSFLTIEHQSGSNDPQSYANGEALYKKGDFAGARAAFEPLALKGNPQAQVYMGVMYAKGQGIAQDFVQAQKWFILAGDAGKSNRDVVGKGLTPAEEQQAEAEAKAWKPRG